MTNPTAFKVSEWDGGLGSADLGTVTATGPLAAARQAAGEQVDPLDDVNETEPGVWFVYLNGEKGVRELVVEAAEVAS